MAMEKKKCTSCGLDITFMKEATSFPCPNCGEVTINRCAKCREGAVGYECPKCGFEGP